jgi:hypothetical protein
VPLSPSTGAVTATPLYLIKAFISTSACLLTSIIVSLLHTCHCVLSYRPTLSHLLSKSCYSSHFPAMCVLLCFAKISILIFSTLLLFLSSTFCTYTTACCHSVHFWIYLPPCFPYCLPAACVPLCLAILSNPTLSVILLLLSLPYHACTAALL